MTKKRLGSLLFLAALFIIPPQIAQADSLASEVGQDLISPVTTEAWIPLAVGSGLAMFIYLDRYSLDRPLQQSWSVRKPLGQASQFGDLMGEWVPNLAYSLGMAIDGWGYDNKVSKGRSILMLKATVYSGIMAVGLKYAFGEQRPNGSNDMASFPSGHATTAFAFASVVGAEHEWYWGVAAYAMAAFTGASRINDNMHWLHDVVGGATLGMSYGLGLYYRAHQDDAPKEQSNTVYQILPTDRMDGMILTGTYEF